MERVVRSGIKGDASRERKRLRWFMGWGGGRE